MVISFNRQNSTEHFKTNSNNITKFQGNKFAFAHKTLNKDKFISFNGSEDNNRTDKPKTKYEECLEKIKAFFPDPTPIKTDSTRLSAVIDRVLKDSADSKVEDKPYSGEYKEVDFNKAREAKMPEKIGTLEDTINDLKARLNNLPNFNHPKNFINCGDPTTIMAIAGALVAALENPVIDWDEYGHYLSSAEVEATAMMANLIGFDPKNAVGIFTFGGTACNLYGAKIGLTKALPNSAKEGVTGQKQNPIIQLIKRLLSKIPFLNKIANFLFPECGQVKIIAGKSAHSSKLNIINWLGIGTNNLINIPINEDQSMKIDKLRETCEKEISKGNKIGCIMATMGTTDSMGMDDLQKIAEMRDELVKKYKLDYVPHIHADAVIGWVMSVFNDYDLDKNPLQLSDNTIEKIKKIKPRISTLKYADSVGIDFHKTGYAPFVSSLFITKDRKDFDKISRKPEDMPYLYQFGNYMTGNFTLELSRGALGALPALMNISTMGKEGFQVAVAHNIEMAQALRDEIAIDPTLVTINNFNDGQMTLFRAYPEGMDAKTSYKAELTDPAYKEQLLKINEYNRRIFNYIHNQMLKGKASVLSQTDHFVDSNYGEPVLALKQFVASVFTDTKHIKELVAEIKEAQKAVKFDDIKLS